MDKREKAHASDCATNNEPAAPNGTCDCHCQGYATIPMGFGEVHLSIETDQLCEQIAEHTEDNLRGYLGARVKYLKAEVERLKAEATCWDCILWQAQARYARMKFRKKPVVIEAMR